MEEKANIAIAGTATRCPKCGNEVACGAQVTPPGDTGTANVTCWCLDWPHLPASARLGVGACLCPACLRAALLAAGGALKGTPADLP